MNEIAFRCRTCGAYGEIPGERQPDWASLAGFDSCTEWLVADEGSDPASSSLMQRPPVAGDVCTLRIRYPFRSREGTAFWALFQPAFTAVNGWLEAPEELDASCLVECRDSEVVALTAEVGIIRVEVGQVVSVAAVAERFEPRSGGVLPPYPASGGVRFDRGEFRVIDWNLEGDAGAWFVCQREERGWVLLLMGEWGHGYDFFYAGHRPLSPSEVGDLWIE